jgi:formylglycine-generating enzyme required for sulfatase activity
MHRMKAGCWICFVLMISAVARTTAQDRGQPPEPAPLDPVAAYLQCPTSSERQAIDKDFDIRFLKENGWDRVPYSCDYADKGPTRAKIYKVLEFIKDVNFSKPLPFTKGKSAYDFLARSGKKLSVVPQAQCGGTSAGANFTLTVNTALTRWFGVLSGSPTCAEANLRDSPDLVATGVYHPLYAAALIIHEGSHAVTGKPHTSQGGNDATIDEMGSWAAQFYYEAWIALYSTNTDARLKERAKTAAGDLLSRFTSNHCPADSALREVVNTIRPRACLDRSEISAVSMEFISIPPGEFMMGCSAGDNACQEREKPSHRVRITKGFEIGKYEVTQAAWEAVMRSNPSRFQSPDLPVDRISWNEVQQFLLRLNNLKDGYRYRLPTESEWEYAARAGSTDPLPSPLTAFAWFNENSSGMPHPVGQKQPNAWGLYDVIGNVAEFVQDWYDEKYYSHSPEADPKGPSNGTARVIRSSLAADPGFRISNRGFITGPPTGSAFGLGVRCVRERI